MVTQRGPSKAATDCIRIQRAPALDILMVDAACLSRGLHLGIVNEHLNGGGVLLQADDLADQPLRTDADELVHGCAGHGLGHDHGAADLEDGPGQWRGEGRQADPSGCFTVVRCMTKERWCNTHPVFSLAGAILTAGRARFYALSCGVLCGGPPRMMICCAESILP